jgi:hypothetical protein
VVSDPESAQADRRASARELELQEEAAADRRALRLEVEHIKRDLQERFHSVCPVACTALGSVRLTVVWTASTAGNQRGTAGDGQHCGDRAAEDRASARRTLTHHRYFFYGRWLTAVVAQDLLSMKALLSETQTERALLAERVERLSTDMKRAAEDVQAADSHREEQACCSQIGNVFVLVLTVCLG